MTIYLLGTFPTTPGALILLSSFSDTLLLTDSRRLNLMHHIWTKIFDYTLHPRIPTESANLRVADVATGTGYVPVVNSISASSKRPDL